MAKARLSKPKPHSASPRPKPVADIPMLEWIAAGVGLVLASTAIGLTAWDAVFGVRGPPVIEVRIKRVTPTAHGYVAEIEAHNHGGSPAAQVEIEGVIAGQRSASTANLTIDYIPQRSRATGGLIFEQDPRVGTLKLRAKGFADAS